LRSDGFEGAGAGVLAGAARRPVRRAAVVRSMDGLGLRVQRSGFRVYRS
jgi:hypothetical protein